MDDLVGWAAGIARRYLTTPEFTERRWRHVQAVAAKGERLRPVAGGSADLLHAACWVHDIGYAPQLHDTGFHPVDGARALRRWGASEQLCGLVAHHSGARHEAQLRGLGAELAEFRDEPGQARDGLWFCDMTTGPAGAELSFEARLCEIRQRYGADHTVPRAIAAAAPEIRAAIHAVQQRAAQVGVRLG
ncbi:HD domain-containing protein [Actinocatenispora rupis]|uniref:Metal-dependent phosphohydrolase, HD subdomain protein n=1 Tax=Actinocatenispora rupis TaxID=519421 RepID=A0A8J3JHB7_9ACTN|nr:HD domain-containing protein [Actinocatenispora rupis]GID14928.1 metal-dependent phosphohydrolase, HD subdomain protein [Actinocatenispora rupis]